MEIHVDSQYAFLRDSLKDLPRRFAEGEGVVLHEGRNSVRVFDIDGLRLVVKRYKPVCFVRQIAYTFFCRTKAEKAFLFAEILRERGFDTPREVAYIKQRRFGLFHVGYFVSLPCDYPTAYSALVPVSEYNRELASDMAALFVQMHLKGIVHGDMNLGNFLFHKKEDGHYAFSIIDTNRSRFLDRPLNRKESLQNLRTVTFRRDLYEYIVCSYAAIRGWDIRQTEQEASRLLTRFERWKTNKRKWKEIARKILYRG